LNSNSVAEHAEENHLNSLQACVEIHNSGVIDGKLLFLYLSRHLVRCLALVVPCNTKHYNINKFVLVGNTKTKLVLFMVTPKKCLFCCSEKIEACVSVMGHGLQRRRVGLR
jgi:hypothetical protein